MNIEVGSVEAVAPKLINLVSLDCLESSDSLNDIQVFLESGPLVKEVSLLLVNVSEVLQQVVDSLSESAVNVEFVVNVFWVGAGSGWWKHLL